MGILQAGPANWVPNAPEITDKTRWMKVYSQSVIEELPFREARPQNQGFKKPFEKLEKPL